MQPPHEIARDFVRLLASGKMNGAIRKTLGNAAIAFGLALVAGVSFAALLHGLRALRATLDPLFATYYAVPVFAFYPFLIVVFGLGDLPQVLIGFMLAVVAVIVNTLNGLDRVPRVLVKTARIHRLGRVATALRDHAALRRPVHPDRCQARGRLFADRRHRLGVHHVARRHRLRDQLRLQELRQRDDVPADPADPDRVDRAERLLSRWEKRLLVRRGQR